MFEQKKKRYLSQTDKYTLASNIALGIKHLHDIGKYLPKNIMTTLLNVVGIAHRDLKCDNILVQDSPLSACIGDFGIARALGAADKTARGGTWRYMCK